MPRLIKEVRANDFHRTGKDSAFIIQKMKSGEIREDANGKKTLSFREKKVVNDDGPLGVPVEDWFQIIAFFTVFYSFMAGFFSLLYFWNSSASNFEPLFVFLGAFIVVLAGIIYVSYQQYVTSAQKANAKALAAEDGL